MKLAIGIVTYEENSAKYLPYFLQSLKAQTWQDFELLVFDNSEKESEKNKAEIQKIYPNIISQGVKKNLGFARAYNFLIREAIDKKCEYFLVINSDVILEPDVLEKMIKALDGDKELGSACPKLKRWDFARNLKTNVIDSCGIELLGGLRFVDSNQGKINSANIPIKIIGPSGAAAMYRLTALQKVIYNNQFFDEMMFMYKEDCDLAYRLYLAGFKTECVADAIGYHDRSVAGQGEGDLATAVNRKNKSRQAKEWAFLNQQIIFYKYWRLQSLKNKLMIIWFEIKMFVFIILFEQYLLKQLKHFRKIKKTISGLK